MGGMGWEGRKAMNLDLRSEAEMRDKTYQCREPNGAPTFSPQIVLLSRLTLTCPGQFQDFTLRDPIHGKLFSTYLCPSQTPNASSPGSPTALANGTVHSPKQKGD